MQLRYTCIMDTQQTDSTDLEQELVQVKEHLNVLNNLLSNMVVVDSFGKKSLRPNVKEKDIKMVSEAIVKIKDNYKGLLNEMETMKQREANTEQKYIKTREKFILFAKDLGIKMPQFFKDFYQLED